MKVCLMQSAPDVAAASAANTWPGLEWPMIGLAAGGQLRWVLLIGFKCLSWAVFSFRGKALCSVAAAAAIG